MTEPSKQARDKVLQIDEAECELEQPIGPNDGWNLGHSTVTYYRESVAVEQAQLVWNKSRIVEHYRKGKLLRARYGVKEVETGYVSWEVPTLQRLCSPDRAVAYSLDLSF